MKEELTITAITKLLGNSWTLWVEGQGIPPCIVKGRRIEPHDYYRVRLKNTENLSRQDPSWYKSWNKDNLLVDITSYKENFNLVMDHGLLTLTIKLRDDAEIETWYGDEW